MTTLNLMPDMAIIWLTFPLISVEDIIPMRFVNRHKLVLKIAGLRECVFVYSEIQKQNIFDK